MTKNKLTQNKKDRIKEFIMKGLILTAGFFAIAMFGLAIFGRDGEFAWLFVVLVFVCIVLAIICTIIVFAIGNTIKTDNPKDWKIKKYLCGLDEPVKESCNNTYDEVYSFNDGTDDFYCLRIKPDGLTRSEMYCFAYIETDENFNEDMYISKIGQITQLNRKDIYARTLIVCFAEKGPCKYVKEIIHSAEYYGLNEVLILCVYDEENKTLKVNKTKCAFGDKAYNDARKELSKIFSFVKPQQAEKPQAEV